MTYENHHDHDHHHHHSESLEAVEQTLSEPQDMIYWRSLENRERTKAYVEMVKQEFQEGESEISGFQRREMLKLMGASFALAGVGVACRRPEVKIMPYTKQPETVLPGIPNHYATTYAYGSDAYGLIVESHEGRPTKIEGNPNHPSSQGRADLYAQASVLQLYDPDRSRVPTQKSDNMRMPVSWVEWDSFAQDHFASLVTSKGQGLAFLSEGLNTPTFNRLRGEIAKQFPQAVFYSYHPVNQDNADEGASAVFGKERRVNYRLENAKILVTIHADPLMQGPSHLRHARTFGERRRISKPQDVDKMNRLYAIEASYSITGTNADHRLPLTAVDTESFMAALALELFVKLGLAWPTVLGKEASKESLMARLRAAPAVASQNKRFLSALAKDLMANRGASLLMVGETQCAFVHAIAHIINTALGGLNSTFYLSKVEEQASSSSSLSTLAEELEAGRITTLLVLGSNPAYASPGQLNLSSLLLKAKTLIHMGLYEDETAKLAHWHLPMTHYLETWGDAVSYEGVASLIQPLIAPLHDARSVNEILAQVANLSTKKAHDILQATWRGPGGLLASDKVWQKALHDGVVSATSSPVEPEAGVSDFNALVRFSSPSAKGTLEISFQPSYSVLGGSLANLGWLQELPDPITKMNWGNALLMGPETAKQLGITSRLDKRVYKADVVDLTFPTVEGKTVIVETPVFLVPGMPFGSGTLCLGYGRTSAGSVAEGVGINAYPALPLKGARRVTDVQLKRLGRSVSLSTSQEQFAMNGEAIQEITTLSMQKRDVAREANVDEYVRHPNYAQHEGGPKDGQQMTKPWSYEGNKWGMVIDLNSCIGCNACVTACVAENNIPVVGPTQVMRGRIMHWLRVDRYFTGDVNNPRSISQPVPCMHCENAPCESVCPVAATSHDTEGLNVMTYNRCVGTRYCGNNCPYKVRRFNYFDYSNSGDVYVAPEKKERRKLLQMQYNPQVTIRYRGVMEKCTYCTQRIQEAKMQARKNKKDPNQLADGAVTPACAQTCPTNAITFGNLNDPNSKVVQLKALDRNYTMMNDLNVRPRTSYLSKLRNPNPELV